ncbi:DDE Tnp4 domain-containing protein [Mycena indigotica]|uniref:DDE Tnp4 domain-containing protein n=1 Tax=Mycena indigotica TaxID=2126181 RepID=A0A8H6T1X2_9AGAR|nr:DDE Tnp4 domain-containing protein [Mycena indigotica]KAF7309345.1 DDE Tnp4 domain-containing protein [Mycena indigotica]
MACTDSRRGRVAALLKSATAYARQRQHLLLRRRHRLKTLGLSAASQLSILRASIGLPRRLPTIDLDDNDDWSSSTSSTSSESSSSDSDSSVDSFELRNEPLRIPCHQCRIPGGVSRIHLWVQSQIDELYAQRYNVPRTCLKKWKHSNRVAFRGELRIWPTTFDKLLRKIEHYPVFTNNSNSPQTPVELQLAVALYQFGHDGNGASLQSVSWWSGLGKGTIPLCTRRVITSILGSGMLAKTSGCWEWREGWCMVDGTLIPLVTIPSWYGPGYFDRKMNYSMNLQVVNLPNLQIIDIGYGYVGSTHDATAWTGTRVYQQLDQLLLHGEFIWGDAAYPISRWLTAPFKSPEREVPDNMIFNNHVSYVRVRSEHCISFLKGRQQSLKGLRLHITNKADHKYATQWIMACVTVHNFALLHEAKLRAKRPGNTNYTAAEDDLFIPKHIRCNRGLNGAAAGADAISIELEQTSAGQRARLAAGKAKWNELKGYLLNALATRRQQLGFD